MDRIVRVSKFLAKILRHSPQDIGLELQAGGWANVADLLEKSARAGVAIDRTLLEEVVANNDKKRFAFSEDGTLIRASQGHSVGVELDFEEKEPPEFLYHGTVEKFLTSILSQGLHKMKRHHVHLSRDKETAAKVGSRRGKPVILEVLAGTMHAGAHKFFLSANGVWLTDHVPVTYLRRLG